jgi:hypothetical protein
MQGTTRLIAVILAVVLFTEATGLSIGSKNAAYFGGTITMFDNVTAPIEGRLDTTNPDQLVFVAIDKKSAGKSFSIPYGRIIDLEYGQKAGRRVGTTVATAVLFGPVGLLPLLSKKRKHYLTVSFKDESGKDQVAVIELGKNIVRSTLPIVETRSGKKVQYQDEEARKSGR